jgi:hypothetical protein
MSKPLTVLSAIAAIVLIVAILPAISSSCQPNLDSLRLASQQ